MWYVYIIQNTEGIYYCGITKSIERRLLEHNGILPGGAKYTRRGRPWTSVASVSVETMSEALKLEAKIKKVNRDEKISLLDNYVPR